MPEANGDDHTQQVQFLTDRINFCKHASSSWVSIFQALCFPYKRLEQHQDLVSSIKHARSASESTKSLAKNKAVISFKKWKVSAQVKVGVS